LNLSKKTQKSISSLQDLADLAGVSRATASRALNDSPLLNGKTKERLRKLAKKHNYSVNRRASDFRLRRTRVISVVFMLDLRSGQHMSDPFFLDMLGSIADSLAEYDYDLLLTHNVLDLRESRVMKNSDGVIFVGQGEQHEKLNELAKGETPIVVWGYPIAGKNYVVVGSENLSGGYQSTKHLLDLKHQKIAFFGNTGNPENAARHKGYLQALSDSGFEADADLKVDIPFEMHRARQAIIKFMASKASFDAVVCASDVMALASISTFQELGLGVPQDVAVVGFDDIRLAAYSSPPLTTVRQNIREAGSVLVESVLAMIKGEEVTDTILPSELIVRRSSGA